MARRILSTFYLLCPSFDTQRRDLAEVVQLLPSFVKMTNLPNDALTQLLYLVIKTSLMT